MSSMDSAPPEEPRELEPGGQPDNWEEITSSAPFTDRLMRVYTTRDVAHYTHPDFPSLHIKASDIRLWETGDENALQNQHEAYTNLRETGVEVVPFVLSASDETFYAITQRVEGIPLEQVLATNPSALAEYDRMAAGLIDYMSAHRGVDMWMPDDIFESCQYMWGKPAGQDRDKVSFVDIETTSGGLVINYQDLEDDGAFIKRVAWAASAVLRDEQTHSIELRAVRASITAQLDRLRGTQLSRLAASRITEIEEALQTGDLEAIDEW